MKAIKNPKRIPRKLKKEIKKVYMYDTYQEIMSGRMFIAPKMINRMTDLGWVAEDHGMTLFFNIDDSFSTP